ncbi:type II secretion system F family protein [Pseudorhodoferax sp.]|uniref:type II secretion system F family protein n=1 Tax=Pseudorhodoferax sp. TaxID=1993553 RepID=UPI002DD68B92|nr:type II secretion system F family protein [Pseudorhodoferax sp.]
MTTTHWTIRCYDAAHAVVREHVVRAGSRAQAMASAEEQGLVVLDLRRDARPISMPSGPAARRLDVTWWCKELRVLLAAGMTVVEAIEAMQAQTRDPGSHMVLDEISRALQQGLPLSASVAASGHFPPMLVAGIVAAERTGALIEALDDYLHYDGLVEALRRKLVSAAIYPSLILGLGAVVVIFLLLFVMPRFATIYAGLPGGVTGFTSLLLTLGMRATNNLGLLTAAMLALAGSIAWAWRQGLLSRWMLQGLERFGPLRQRIDEFRMAKLYQSLALMLRGGYTLDEALDRCQKLRLGPRIETAIGQVRSDIARGRRVSAALDEAKLSDEIDVRLLRVAERTGNFDHVLQTLGNRHGDRFANTIDRVARLAEPLLLLAVSLAVGAVVVLMYMPIFDIAGGIR